MALMEASFICPDNNLQAGCRREAGAIFHHHRPRFFIIVSVASAKARPMSAKVFAQPR